MESSNQGEAEGGNYTEKKKPRRQSRFGDHRIQQSIWRACYFVAQAQLWPHLSSIKRCRRTTREQRKINLEIRFVSWRRISSLSKNASKENRSMDKVQQKLQKKKKKLKEIEIDVNQVEDTFSIAPICDRISSVSFIRDKPKIK